MSDHSELIKRLERATCKDWRLDEEIVAALGGHIRRVGRLGLNGSSRGSERVFWPTTDPHGQGNSVPSYTKTETSRLRAIKRLRALSPEEEKRS